MFERPDFDRAQNAATELLLQQDLDSLFIDIRGFHFDRRIFIDSIQNYANFARRPLDDFTCIEFNGCCVIPYSRCNLVLYDDNEDNDYRKHWGIVHEVGHVYLEHDKDGEKEEKEANFFAAQIVAPEIVLCDMWRRQGSLCAEDLTAHFNISHEAAMKRISTLNKRRCFNNSNIDQLLLNKFSLILDSEIFSQLRRPQKNYGPLLDWNSEIGGPRNLHQYSPLGNIKNAPSGASTDIRIPALERENPLCEYA